MPGAQLISTLHHLQPTWEERAGSLLSTSLPASVPLGGWSLTCRLLNHPVISQHLFITRAFEKMFFLKTQHSSILRIESILKKKRQINHLWFYKHFLPSPFCAESLLSWWGHLNAHMVPCFLLKMLLFNRAPVGTNTVLMAVVFRPTMILGIFDVSQHYSSKSKSHGYFIHRDFFF